MRLRYTLPDVARGVLVYSAGDTMAALILSQFSVQRMLGMMIIGGTVYALEIPSWFRWISRRTGEGSGLAVSLRRTGLALAYFNPLWIARHLLFIAILSGNTGQIGWDLLRLGVLSFIANIPVTAAANYMIQNRIPLKWRFLSSAVFSSLMAIYYALSRTIFR